jgi:hypothetical protein
MVVFDSLFWKVPLDLTRNEPCTNNSLWSFDWRGETSDLWSVWRRGAQRLWTTIPWSVWHFLSVLFFLCEAAMKTFRTYCWILDSLDSDSVALVVVVNVIFSFKKLWFVLQIIQLFKTWDGINRETKKRTWNSNAFGNKSGRTLFGTCNGCMFLSL